MILKNKVCIVSGAASGIGQATAVEMARQGGTVIACDISKEGLQATLDIISNGTAVVRTKRCDITNPTEIEKMTGAVLDEFGAIDVLVNCAGGSTDSSSLLDITAERFDWTMDLNLKSIFLMMKAVLPHMVKRKSGAIVNVSSQAGRRGSEFTKPHYTAAKAGVLGLTRHAAKEFGSYGIRVNAVAPGRCATSERNRQIWKEREESGDAARILGSVALKRVSAPEEQAKPICFLCSDQASYITGATLDVNGGETCI